MHTSACLLTMNTFNVCAFVSFTCAIIIYKVHFANAAIPSYIQTCKRSDPNLESCVKSSIINLRQKLADGIPELNVPGVEPLRISRLELSDNVNINVTDLEITGPSNFDIAELKVDINKNRFIFLYKFKELKFTGKYDIDMEILQIPLKSSGPMHGYFKNCQLSGKMQGKKTKINDRFHMIFRPIELKIHQGETRMYLENLFRGQKELQAATNDLLNENNTLLSNEILPALEKKLGEYFTRIANGITSQFTYDELFPLV